MPFRRTSEGWMPILASLTCCLRYHRYRADWDDSTDASAYRAGVYRGGVYRGGVDRGGYYRGVRPGVAVGIGAAAPVGCPYGYYYYAPCNCCVPTP